ncbi:Tim44 domain-containing protein [Pseudoalteromonas fenneropenaei]|uniref:Tim44 domain-containing protein n=1 Tax=Pseudoalteromonas fenneropenaei TaxID=1737459 RepID=A0ABV7CN73_9GAMM
MKQLIVVLSLMTFLFATSFDAFAAKKFGSKKSGTTHKTETAQPKQQVDTKTLPTNTATKPTSSKKGIMAGVLGGLLAGGLIAAMLGDDFEGFQWLEMLILAVLAFVIFKVIKSAMAKRQQPAYATQGASPLSGQFGQQQQPAYQQPQAFTPASQAGFSSTSDVPFNLPRDFDMKGFLSIAENHYRTIQKAWNENDLNTVNEYLSPELIEEFKAERASQGDVSTDVLFVSAELVRADTSPVLWEVSVMFRGKYRDNIAAEEAPIHEIWHLERKTEANAPWLIVGVEDLAAE